VGELYLPDEISYARTQVRSWENLGTLTVRLTGSALALAGERGVSECKLSMTHTKRTALAVVILEGGKP